MSKAPVKKTASKKVAKKAVPKKAAVSTKKVEQPVAIKPVEKIKVALVDVKSDNIKKTRRRVNVSVDVTLLEQNGTISKAVIQAWIKERLENLSLNKGQTVVQKVVARVSDDT